MHGLSLVAECRGYSQVAVGGLLIAVAFLVVEHWLFLLWSTGLVTPQHVESSPEQGLNMCPLHWEADS